ncbi:carboxylating nicotinate-nucleotide diphosphorylase [Bdellovibrionota bacterium FG-2]
MENSLLYGIWKDLLIQGLREDGAQWDWTALGSLGCVSRASHASIIAKCEGVWAAAGLVSAGNLLSGAEGFACSLKSTKKDGQPFKPEQELVTLKGPAAEILALERPFLNLCSFACGIATATSDLVARVKRACPSNPPRVTSTRKTLPHLKDISVWSVLCGGGYAHRLGLSGGVLIKENHIAASGGMKKAVQGARSLAPHGMKIEIEVRSQKELKQALEARADGVLLDNFSPKQVREAVDLISTCSPRPFVEVSGGLNSLNIENYAIAGVDVLSVGSLTHSVKSSDLSLLIEV